MRPPIMQRSSRVRFNITPLIDIVFLLIIFFLVSSHFVQSETQSPIELPTARKIAEESDDNPKRLVITIDRQQQMLVSNRVVDISEVEHMIGEGRQQHGAAFEVRIRGDRSVPFATIEPVLINCAMAGVGQVRFAVIQK